ncbi:BMP family lipoprotein [Fusibacter ferrireducens]|uniref:BMP family ABC transporter substrate-binding protein n=1 Tax=Fusibacter ferrireducens TaxID=2785058 RepID=A0ABR9ZM72_9FIRM|nr:BMP family ABC transporter substrate-binding protein [Fusibacter ferrireducens]MBF4691572.1 BMP family ABC transporter substrate-binding protein [Fusibacter ferrireducens]
MKAIKMIFLLALILGVFVGCQAKDEVNEAVKSEDTARNAFKVAMVTNSGGVNDKGFNESAWNGLQRTQSELGFEVGYIESQLESDFLTNLETLYEQGNDMIWGIGYFMEDVLMEAAERNPDQMYGGIDIYFPNPPENLVGVQFKEYEAAFLVGYIAGKMTETDKVGFVGGMEIPPVLRYQYGFMSGVKKANPDCEIKVQYANNFLDVALGKTIANQMYQNDIDIIFPAAGATGTGCIESAKDNDKYIIGVDLDQYELAPDNIITSAMKNVDQAIFTISNEFTKSGEYASGNVAFGLKEGAVGISPNSDKHVPQEILDEVNQIKEDIISGALSIPENKEAYDALYNQ